MGAGFNNEKNPAKPSKRGKGPLAIHFHSTERDPSAQTLTLVDGVSLSSLFKMSCSHFVFVTFEMGETGGLLGGLIGLLHDNGK